MSMKPRQATFIASQVQAVVEELLKLYGPALNTWKAYKVEFDAAGDNNLQFGADSVIADEDIVSEFGFDSGDVASACNKTLKNFTDMMDGLSIVAAENGEFARRVRSGRSQI